MNKASIWRGVLTALSGLAMASGAAAHHSYAEYDQDAAKLIEIEGTLVKARWINPHSHLEVRIKGPDGKPAIVSIESGSTNAALRGGIPLEVFKVGSTVKVAGWPSRRSKLRMYGTNILSQDGQEAIIFPRAPARWTDKPLNNRARLEGGPVPTVGPPTIFHVWSSASYPGTGDNRDYELTPAGQKAKDAFDPVKNSGSPLKYCEPKGMPSIMMNPQPMSLEEQGKDRIVLRLEEYDTVRTIHLNSKADPAKQPKSSVGFSTGRWENGVLVVETSRINARFLESGQGIPLGPNVSTVERFTPSADGLRLDYEVVITDPQILAKPAVLKRAWAYRPDTKVMAQNCKEVSNK